MKVVDRYADVVLHHERIDWSREDLDADVLTAEFIGKVGYWKDPDFAGMGPHEIEKEILLSAGRDQWHQESPYGKPYYQHFLTLMKVLFPKTDITPTLADAVLFFCLGLGFKKILNLIGCQNASKSAGCIRMMFTAMFIDPKNTVGYVANPFDNAADSTVWGDVEELWDELCEAWPLEGAKDVPSLFPNGVKYANKKLVFIPGVPKAGHISLRHVKHTGKLKGTKTRGKQTARGIMFVYVDEINEIDSHAFLTTLENVSAQDAFFGFTTQNFKDEEDMGGQITAPVPTFNGPSTFDELDLETDLWWHSAKSSITLRFDGHKQANILACRVIYPYLLKQKDLDRLAESGGGEESLIYYSQARSFPVRGGGMTTVLTQAKLSASRHTDPHYQVVEIKDAFGFNDPAFGGRDASVYGWWQWVVANVEDNEGGYHKQDLLIFREKMLRIPFVKDAIYNDFWLGRLKAVNVDTSTFTKGSMVSFEDQIAIRCAEENLKNNIPAHNFGFDFSMRPDIVSSVNKIIGFGAVAFDYNQAPEGCYMTGIKKQSEDYCHDRVTELAFNAADFFLTKQIRGGEHIEPAITQLKRTHHIAKGKKRAAEKKAEFKARWQNRSPDERDVLMGLGGMANKRGFRQDGLKDGKKSESTWSEINDRNIGKSRVRPLLR